VYDDIRGIQITTPQAAPIAAAAVTVSGHRHFDDVGCELRQVVPPCRGETASRSVLAVAPHDGSNPRSIGERSVVDEVDAAAASNPMTGSESLHRLHTQAGASSLVERNHTVVAA
jgi:hypothetical protein